MNRTYDSGCGIEHVRTEGEHLPLRVLILPALFDEANRMRRMTVQLMHRLAARDVGAILPDLPGTGESGTDLAHVACDDWAGAVRALRPMLAPGLPLTVGLRGGALLDHHASAAPGAMRAWRLSPETGARVLRDLDRARLVGGGEPAYAMTPDFRRDLAAAVPADSDPAAHAGRIRTVRLVGDPAPADRHVDGTRLWRQAEPGEDAPLVDRLAEDIAAWAHACAA